MVQAIPTLFDGYFFRSRLEARWAVFFRTLRIRYRYESEGFLVGAGEKKIAYLPDFFLTDTETWVEVKGDAAAFDQKILGAAIDYGCGLPDTADSVGTTRGLLLLGPIPNPENGWPLHPILQHSKGGWVERTVFGNRGVLPVDPCGDRYFDGLCEWPPETWDEIERDWDEPLSLRHRHCPPLVSAAYFVARKARFEHGDQP